MGVPYLRFESYVALGGSAAIGAVEEFFMGTDPVHQSLDKIVARLNDAHIEYAIVGGMALAAHGYVRATVDVDILITSEGLKQIHERLDGLGYTPPFPGSKQLRDGDTKVRIEFLVSGQFPGDGKPKPVAFPNPADVGVDIDGIRYLRLETLIDLKLASGMTGGVGRMKDITDVVELIKALKLPADYAARLSPYTREKFSELWTGLLSDVDQNQL